MSARDLDGVLGVVSEAAAANGDTPFELPVIDRLARLVAADHVGYYEYRTNGENVFQIETSGSVCDEVVQQWTERVSPYLPYWPLHDALLVAFETAVNFSDFVGDKAKRRNPWYTEVMRPRSQEYECKLLLADPAPDLNSNNRGFFFVRQRGRKDFDERDRAMLTVLRSQLAAIRDRWERRRRPAGLTDREAEIVHLLREGLTNQEIADRLVISTGTVRAHLENMFDKLGVHTRTAAVARAFDKSRSPNPS